MKNEITGAQIHPSSFTFRVYQRDASGKATIPLSNTESVKVRVLEKGQVIIPWHDAEGCIREVPTGGPYTLEIESRSGKKRKISGILVGDLWVLAGQSNMDGCGKLQDVETPSPKVNAFYYNESWGVAKEPLCVVVDSIDPVHWPCEEKDLPQIREEDHKFRDIGAGLGIRFGKEVYKASGVPIGLLVCSHGGTSIEQWDPALEDQGGRSLYGSMMRRIHVCGGKVAGLLWYQGESNANLEMCEAYKDRMRGLITAVRSALDAPCLPFLTVQIGRFFTDELVFPPAPWNRIQQLQLEMANEMDNVAMVAAIDSTLSDAIHIDAISGRRLGARLAKVALRMAYGQTGAMPLVPDCIRFADLDRSELRVGYRNIQGKLAPASGVMGFYVEDESVRRVPIASATVDGSNVVLKLERSIEGPVQLWYGRGCNPTTNLHDDLFAAPVFGPVTV